MAEGDAATEAGSDDGQLTATGKDTSDDDWQSVEVLIHLAESRSHLHGSFASNALTVLSIQLAVLPLSFAVASFVASPTIPSSIEGGEERLIWIVGQVFLALTLFVTSVILSFDVYRLAKEQQYVWLDLLRDVCYPGYTEEVDFDRLDGNRKTLAELVFARSNSIDRKVKTITDKFGFGYDPLPAEEKLRLELGTRLSDEHKFRMQLLTSIALSILAAFFSVSGILTVIGRDWLGLILLAVLGALMVAYTLWIYMDILAPFVHSPKTGVSNAVAAIWTVFTPGIRMIGQSLSKYVQGKLSQGREWVRNKLLFIRSNL